MYIVTFFKLKVKNVRNKKNILLKHIIGLTSIVADILSRRVQNAYNFCFQIITILQRGCFVICVTATA